MYLIYFSLLCLGCNITSLITAGTRQRESQGRENFSCVITMSRKRQQIDQSLVETVAAVPVLPL